MNWFTKIFKIKKSNLGVRTNKDSTDYFEGLEAYKIGRKLFRDSVDYSFPKERRKQKTIAALEFFDTAIEKGYDEADVFSFRGNCLRDINYYLDALDDFNASIDKDPERASFYYERAMTKQFIYDFEGSLLDYKEAIRLSKLDNANTKYWNEYAKQTGYNSASQKYEQDLSFMMYNKERAEKNQARQEMIKKEKANIKRRFS